MSACNIALRAETLNMKQELDSATALLAEAEKKAEEAAAALVSQAKKAKDELEKKMKGFAELNSTVASLRTDIAALQGEVDYANANAAVSEKAAAEAQEAAAAAQTAEIKARAELKVKCDEETRLSSACAALHMEVSASHADAEKAKERIATLEGTIAELRAEMKWPWRLQNCKPTR